MAPRAGYDSAIGSRRYTGNQSDQMLGDGRLALRPKEAAKALGIGERKLWELTNRRIIPHLKAGRATLYPVAALRDWLAREAAKNK